MSGPPPSQSAPLLLLFSTISLLASATNVTVTALASNKSAATSQSMPKALSSRFTMSLPNNTDNPVARLEAELAQEKAAHARTAKALQSITCLHETQAMTISSQIGIIKAQIQRHPEDIDIIQKEAREAEDDRQRKKNEAISKTAKQ